MKVRSVSFDTSFLLKNYEAVDTAIKALSQDFIHCYITTTVISELEQLRIWGRITNADHKIATRRWKRTHATLIDFKNQFYASTFGKECMVSMKEHHGVEPEDIVNDCSILIATLKNGVDLFLSEDFHFTSKVTTEVIDEITDTACKEYSQMCDTSLYAIDAKTFLAAYQHGSIDTNIIHARSKDIKKDTKVLGKKDNS
jgi:rRNA-processing protein FCF1